MEGLDKLFISDGLKDVCLKFEGLEINLKIKEMSWSRKNQIMSQSFEFRADGQNMAFNLDLYNKLCLQEIIKEAPWGETNIIFLSRIKPEFGALLITLVPKVGDEGKNPSTNFFEQG